MENLLVDLAMQGLEEAAGKWEGAGDANGRRRGRVGIVQGRLIMESRYDPWGGVSQVVGSLGQIART